MVPTHPHDIHFTNEPDDIPSADLDDSGLVDFADFAIFANQWLTAGP